MARRAALVVHAAAQTVAALARPPRSPAAADDTRRAGRCAHAHQPHDLPDSAAGADAADRSGVLRAPESGAVCGPTPRARTRSAVRSIAAGGSGTGEP